MEINNYTKVAVQAEIPVGKIKAVKAGDKEILIANVEGKYYAIENKCDHAGGDLSKGTLVGTIITCPLHKAQYDVTTGKVVTPPTVMRIMHPPINPLISYPVKIELESILVRI